MGAGLALDGKKVLLLDVDPQGDLTKMLGERKPHDLSLTLASAMNDVVSGATPRDHPEIMHHREGFDFVPGKRNRACPRRVFCRGTDIRDRLESEVGSVYRVFLK